jgi:eukaryotic-like serine/threonine-protein kinase
VVGEIFADRYELTELVGTGGMSSVYKAHDRLLERNVALKILHDHYADDDEFVERFRREARAVAQLSHPSIVTVIDRGEADGRQFIVFEYIEGENVKELLVRSGRLPVRRALELALAIARGLAFAHGHGLVHRDVKPQNVLLNGDGEAKVTDFGIARSNDDHAVTLTGTVLGTSNYIAPEQATGQPVDAQTDVYSLGVVLYELLAGDVPFPGESFVSVAMKHVNEPPPNLLDVRRDVPVRVAAAVDRALEKDPRRRFPSMDDFAAELDACLAELDSADDAGEATLVVPAAQRLRPRAPSRRSRWPLAVTLLAIAAVGAIVAGLLLLHTGSSSTETPPGSALIPLTAAGSYDPEGDNKVEHPERVGDVVDHDRSTYWTTERYNSFSKSGVGFVLASSRASAIRSVTLRSDTPGFPAQIQTGASPTGPFHPASPSENVQSTTTFQLNRPMQRYLLIWITALPAGIAHVNEVTASS